MKSLLHPHVSLVLSSLFIIVGTVWIAFNFIPANSWEGSPSAANISAQSDLVPSDLEQEIIKNIANKPADAVDPKENTEPAVPPAEPSIHTEETSPEPPVEEAVAPEPVLVQTIVAEKPVIAPEPAPVVPQAPVAAPVVPAPAPVAPQPVVQTPVQPVAPVDNTRYIYVGHAGGQAVVDQCAGPVLFSANLSYPYIAEHENCGGWQRIGTLHPGLKVKLSGLVAGDYTVGSIINVNKGDTTDALRFATTPRAILQTCIPNTNRMVVVGLY